MYIRFLAISITIFLFSGCAERIIEISDKSGKKVGECNAGFDWHFYGLQDSIDYMLFECAKESIANGLTISDKRLLSLDFSLPKAPDGKSWNKKLAMEQFHQGKITERKLGYILAAIEYEYQKIVWPAESELASGKMTKTEFNKIEKEARLKWLGE